MIYETHYGHGIMTCPTCFGYGKEPQATTTVVEKICWTCKGYGEISYGPVKLKKDAETFQVTYEVL